MLVARVVIDEGADGDGCTCEALALLVPSSVVRGYAMPSRRQR